MTRCVANGISVPVLMMISAISGTYAGHVPGMVRLGRHTRLSLTGTRILNLRKGISEGSVCRTSDEGVPNSVAWDIDAYIEAHLAVRDSGKFNFEGCRIPVPTAINFGRLREALGEKATQKDQTTLELLEFGFPINCNPSFGVKKNTEKS